MSIIKKLTIGAILGGGLLIGMTSCGSCKDKCDKSKKCDKSAMTCDKDAKKCKTKCDKMK